MKYRDMERRKKAKIWLYLTLSMSALALGGCFTATNARDVVREETIEKEEGSEQNTETGDDGGNEIANGISGDELAEKEGTVVAIDETHFPDPAFRDYVNQACDVNHDGFLSEMEILAVTDMKCRKMGIGSLKGVELFSNLERLDCRRNDLTELNIRQNTKLRCLACSETGINTLDVSNCPLLIRALDATGCCYRDDGYVSYGGHLLDDEEISQDEYGSLLRVNADAKFIPEYEPGKGLDISIMFTDIREERWKEIYLELIEKWLNDKNIGDTDAFDSPYHSYRLIYLNDDSVPELVAASQFGAAGSKIYSIINGKVISMSGGTEFFYKERGNLLDDCAGRMGYYFDSIWQIGENGFERIYNCENEVYEWDDDMNPTKQEFWIDGRPASKQEYYELVDGIIPAKDRIFMDVYDSFCLNMKDYLIGQAPKDYKEAYAEIILDNDGEWGYALVERDGAAPLLLSATENCYVTSFDDGMINNIVLYNFMFDEDTTEVYVYPRLGLLEVYEMVNNLSTEEFDYVRIDRYEMRDGLVLSCNMPTNDVEVLAPVMFPDKINKACDPLEYSINYVEVPKDEYMEYLSKTEGKERLKVAPYGSKDAEITYLSKEEMLKKLAEE